MNAQQIQNLHTTRRQRYAERDARMLRVEGALKGELNAEMRRIGNGVKDPAVGNLMASTVRTIAQRVGKPPRLHATSYLAGSGRANKRIERHEAALALRLERQHFAALLPQAAFWLAPAGFIPFMLSHDPKLGHSRIRIRKPSSCYPDTVWPHEPGVDNCLFSYRLRAAELQTAFPEWNGGLELNDPEDMLTVAEYHCDGPTVIAIVEPEAQIVTEIANPTGRCNVWIARDLTPDFDFHGQFDQVIPIMQAEARLLSLVEAYVDQQVSAETVVVGEITSNNGNWATGLGAVNTMEPAPGVSVQKLTNNMSPQVFQQLAMFERQQRITGNMPSALSGESDLSFATGRGIEKLNAPVDDNVGHYQNILSMALYEVFNAIPDFEAAHEVPNPGFAPDVRVQVQFMAGADPATTVRHLQLVGSKVMARRTASNNLPEVNNPEEEEALIVKEALREAMLADILGKASQGAADPKLTIALAKKVGKDKTLEDALSEYYEEVAKAAEASMAAPAPEGAAPGGAPTDLASLFGLSPQGEAVGGTMGKAEIA